MEPLQRQTDLIVGEIKELLAQPESTAEAIMPNGVCVSNVYAAYEEGRKSVMSEQEQEPVAWKVIDGTNGKYMFSRVKPMERSYKYDVVIPLYTSAQKREPLSDEDLKTIAVEEEFLLFCSEDEFVEIARAIEKAHGIGQ